MIFQSCLISNYKLVLNKVVCIRIFFVREDPILFLNFHSHTIIECCIKASVLFPANLKQKHHFSSSLIVYFDLMKSPLNLEGRDKVCRITFNLGYFAIRSSLTVKEGR